jgi:hypothetical protein
MEIEQKITDLGLELPVLPQKATTRRVRGVRTGNPHSGVSSRFRYVSFSGVLPTA